MDNKINKDTRRFEKRLLPIIFTIGLVPLLMHIYAYQSGLEVFEWFPNASAGQNDFFLAWKAIAIIIISIITLIVMGYQQAKERNAYRFENAFYFIFFYLLFVAMSALFSSYKHWVIFGTYELFEPVWVLFAYVILCYYTYNTVRDEKQLNMIILFSGIGVVIALSIGMLQTFGFDLFQTQLGKMLITNPANWNRIEEMKFSLGDLTYITLYNPGYVVFYVGIIFPILLALFSNTKKLIAKICLFVLCLASILCLIGARTTTGWMAILFALVISGLILLSRNKKWFRVGIIIVSILMIVGIAFLLNCNAAKGLRNVILGTYKAENTYGVKSINTDQDICFDFNGVNTHFSFDSDPEKQTMNVTCYDDDNNVIQETIKDDGTGAFYDKNGAEYQAAAIFIGNELGLNISIEGHEWNFAKNTDQTYYYVNAAGKAVKFPTIKQTEIFNEDAMSNRGHIWNKTIPLLAKHIFIGSGANTYLFEVPQEDYLYKNYSNMNNMFDVKPHCWYLQIWIENGLIALLLLLTFYICYFISSVKLYRKVNFTENVHKIGFAIFVGLLIYMIAALVNDSTVNVAPVYWVSLGLGFAVNRIIAEKDGLLQKSQSTENKTITQEMSITHSKGSIPNTKKNRKGKKSRKGRKLANNKNN